MEISIEQYNNMAERLTYLEYKLAESTQWIPCSERLPVPESDEQRREWYLTTNKFNAVSITCYEFENSPFNIGWQTHIDIVAWMRLPEAYRGDKV